MVAKKKKKRTTQICPLCLPLCPMSQEAECSSTYSQMQLTRKSNYLQQNFIWAYPWLVDSTQKVNWQVTRFLAVCQSSDMKIHSVIVNTTMFPFGWQCHNGCNCLVTPFTCFMWLSWKSLSAYLQSHRVQLDFKGHKSDHRSQENNVTVHSYNVDMSGNFLQVLFWSIFFFFFIKLNISYLHFNRY